MNRGTLFSLGDTGRPEDCVVRIVNLHYEADSKDVHEFFGVNFTILDFIRGVICKTSKNTVGYVLLATEQERIDAQSLSGRRILDREVKILRAQSGFRSEFPLIEIGASTNEFHAVSSSGDRLLTPLNDNHGAVFTVRELRNEAPPAIGDVDVFPSLGTAVTPRMPSRTLTIAASHKQPAQ